MAISRRNLVRGLGVGVLGAGVLPACTGGRGGGRETTTGPTAEALEEPDTPLVLGSIGASYGRSAPFEETIALAVGEALVDVNASYGGLFGHEVAVTERHVMAEPGEDLTEVITDMADAGVTAVITSIDEEALVAAIPAFVEAGIAVIDVFTSGMSVRASDVSSAGMLVRLAPNTLAIAARYAEQSWSSSDRGGTPGTVYFVSEDTAQGADLQHQLEQILNPAGGSVVGAHLYPRGEFGDVAEVVSAVVETPPALLVCNGGTESGSFLSALWEATLDEGGRPTVDIAARLSPEATVDYADAELAPECLTGATGFEPGGELTEDHVNMMLNVQPSLHGTGYAYSQQGYDAVMFACLAAQDALSVAGTDIAAAIPGVLTGSKECTDLGACTSILQDARVQGERASVSFTGRMGALELGPEGDPRKGDLRIYSWNEANGLEAGQAESFEIEG